MQNGEVLHHEFGRITMDCLHANKTYLSKISYCQQEQKIWRGEYKMPLGMFIFNPRKKSDKKQSITLMGAEHQTE